MDKKIRLTYALADQNFSQTKSIGIFNYSCQMLASLADRPEIERLTVLVNSTLIPQLTLPERVSVQTHDIAIRGRFGRMWWDQWKVYQAAKSSGNDWLYLPKGFASFTRVCPVRLATCVADGMQDHYRRHYPNSVSRFESLYFEKSFRATVRQSKIIFTISDFSTSEVARLARESGQNPPPIRTMGIGFFPSQASEKRKAGLAIPAGRFPHKRTDLAIAYLSDWQRRRPEFQEPVHWIGSLPPGTSLPNWPNWKLHSRLPEEEYRRLLGSARALIYFSEYEGFGMPPVEGAIAGACPVYSDLPVTREVMQDTGFRFENSSLESFVAALDQSLAIPVEVIEDWAEILLRKHSMASVVGRFVEGLGALTMARDRT